MIVVKLQGGLGNQMFQYAFGRALSLKHQTPFYLDTSFFNEHREERNNFTPRTFELNIFDIQASIASEEQIKRFRQKSFLSKIKRKIGLTGNKTYHEKTFAYNSLTVHLQPPVYLEGYWQSDKYFSEYKKWILQDFTFNKPLDEENLSLLKRIKFTNSVSIHVRRGDFIKSSTNLNHHGVCSLDYYIKAIAEISSKYGDVEFFIFTDDPMWVKEFLLPRGENMTLITGNKGKESWKDMLLMKECKHQIIANSSFSWWGAWLNQNSSKTVIAPTKWLAAIDEFFDFKDLYPTSWLRLKND
jgi:hypothetical protein